MTMDFTGRKAIICGGSRGIGRAIALGLAAAGADVSICARGAEALETTGAEIAAFGHIAHAASIDLGNESVIKTCIAEAAAALGGIDLLVNNASAFGSADDEAAWVASLAIDMLAIVHATQAALPFLTASKGSVVNTSSISALRAAARQPPYGAIKAAVMHYTNTQAAMYARAGVRVNGIAPGSIEFPGGIRDRRKTENPKLYRAALNGVPFGPPGTPEEVANVVMFPGATLASRVTGQAIVVDGGQLL